MAGAGLTVSGQEHWGVLRFDGVDSTAQSSFKLDVNGIRLSLQGSGNFTDGLTGANWLMNSQAGQRGWNGDYKQARVYDYPWDDSLVKEFFDPITRWDLYKPEFELLVFPAAAVVAAGDLLLTNRSIANYGGMRQ